MRIGGGAVIESGTSEPKEREDKGFPPQYSRSGISGICVCLTAGLRWILVIDPGFFFSEILRAFEIGAGSHFAEAESLHRCNDILY